MFPPTLVGTRVGPRSGPAGPTQFPNLRPMQDRRDVSLHLRGCSGALTPSGSWEFAYDLWVPSEVMIWMHKNGNVGPIAQGWNSDGTPVAAATNVTVGGSTWDVYRGGSNVVSLVRQGNIDSGTVDIAAILNWIAAQGWITNTSGLGKFQLGPEITSAPGGLTFTTNSYSMSCGGVVPPTPTPVRTASPTATPVPTGTPVRTATPVATGTPTSTPVRTATPVPSGTPVRTSTPVPPTTTPSGARCTAAYSISSSWGSGFNANITVSNPGTVATKTWKVTWTWGGNQSIVNSWNAAITSSGAAVTANSMAYNGAIAAGGNTSFGFQASLSGTNTNPTLTCSAT